VATARLSFAPLRGWIEGVGRRAVAGLEELGYIAALLVESLYWLLMGHGRRQPVRASTVFGEMMETGIRAIPITGMLLFAVGVMLAIQGLHTLKAFGAQSQVIPGVALSVTREFAPLIVGILVAGRSGSALAARIGTMTVSQEIDALRVIGVSPVRYLVAPALLAMLIMLPALTVMGDALSILGSAMYSSRELDITIEVYVLRTLDALVIGDVVQGLVKSGVFALLISLIGCGTGFGVTGGAEGVGKATTRAVVLSISSLIIADMIFTFFLTRMDV
jgi:phospholipid/cholesterol/gamma-HCH transport system permease protein